MDKDGGASPYTQQHCHGSSQNSAGLMAYVFCGLPSKDKTAYNIDVCNAAQVTHIASDMALAAMEPGMTNTETERRGSGVVTRFVITCFSSSSEEDVMMKCMDSHLCLLHCAYFENLNKLSVKQQHDLKVKVKQGSDNVGYFIQIRRLSQFSWKGSGMDGAMRNGLKILHIICFLLLLGSGDFQVRGLTVTGKDGPTEALRGEDVTIPCLLSGVLIPLNLQILSVVWSLRLQNGTEYKVHQFQDSHHQSWRNGSHMNDRDLQQGNASLYIPNIQITDEGDYLCFVIVTPDGGTATSTLHVLVKPQTTLNYDKRIEAGIPGSVICEINNFYPEAVKVRWVKYSITTATNSSLDRDVSLTIPLRNSDGTFNVTSLLTVKESTGIEPGDVVFCIVNHRSLKEEMTLSFIMPSWSPLKDIVFSLFAFCVITFLTYLLKMYFKKGRRPWIYNVLRFIFIASCIIIVYLLVSLINSLVATDDVRVKIYITLSGIIISYLIGMHFDVTVWRFFRLVVFQFMILDFIAVMVEVHMKGNSLTYQ
ncbi:uncharacterized protein [Aquarana catesbeiana]|uniref:uncharacterized protein n=1 Tax=Aquarana catesbeiana TaxID=8400 RepID=UPI003CCA14B3